MVEFLLGKRNPAILEQRRSDGEFERATRQPPESFDAELSYPIDASKNTLLHHTAQTNDVPIARLLLEWTANPTPINAGLSTPLHTACPHGSLDMIDFLLAHGSDPQALDKRGWSPLHVAVDVGDLGSVRALVEGGRVDLNVKDKRGRTPLQMARDKKAGDDLIALLSSAKSAGSVVEYA
ncbi:hypothetical protein HDU96_010979 [Phlyctochytrium bullatum]|nr:hypothetical protein HDU96_010979 [Phlyctochytrium bullatum]